MRYGLGFKSRFVALAALAAVTGMLMVSSCSKSNPTQVVDNTNSWAFTVTVLDGYGGQVLAGAKVSYTTGEGKDTVVLTGSQGRVRIEGLMPGVQTFRISVDSTYSSAVFNEESMPDSTSKTLIYQDQAKTTKLFPLKGALSGRVVTQRNKLALKAPADSVLVSISYNNPDMSDANPKGFQIKTGADGSFSFNGLPVASGCVVNVANATIGGIDFAPGSISSPTLVPSLSVPMGSIIIMPINASSFKQIGAAPVVIHPNDTITIMYSDAIDSVSYATIEGVAGANGSSGSQGVMVTSIIAGNKIRIIPAVSLVAGSSYWLKIYAYGVAGGDTTSVTTLTVQGGGLVDIAASNVLDGNKQAIDGLGLSDSMTFTFRDSITGGGATVTKNGTPVLTAVSISGAKLTIKPKGNWESTTYSVKVNVNLADNTTSSFNFSIATIGGLDFTTANVYNPSTASAINGIGIADTISITANKTVSSAQVILREAATSGSPVPVSFSIVGATLRIVALSVLKSATAYTLTVSVTTGLGETKSFTTTFTTASSAFYPVIDNIRFDNDPTKPVLNFLPNGTIFIKMSAPVQSATAQIGGAVVPVTVAWNVDTVFITPTTNLSENTAYNLIVSASSKTGTVFNSNNGNYVTGFYVKNTFGPVTSNVRYNSDYLEPVLDFAPNSQMVVVMSDSVVSATAYLSSSSNIPVDVKLAGDTIRIVPQSVLALNSSYSLLLEAKSASGLTYSANTTALPFVKGLTVQNKVRVLASNVLSADGLGLSDIPVTSTLWYLLSDAPDPTTLAVSAVTVATSPVPINKTVTVSGDTVKITPTVNLSAGTKYDVVISGKTMQNNIIAISLNTAATEFTTRSAAFVVAANMLDANGNSVSNLLPTTELWVKFSRPLAAATKQQLTGGSVVYSNGAANNNAVVRVSNDTLFAKFMTNALPAYGSTVTLKSTTIMFADNTVLSPNLNISATIVAKATPYVIATNGIINNADVDTFGVLGEAWIVSSLSFRSIDKVKDGPDVAPAGAATASSVGATNLVVSGVRTSGDTIFYRPPSKLAYTTEFQVAFEVTLADSSTYTGTDLKLRWKTQAPLALTSASDMVSPQMYRSFTVTGDSLVLSFNKAIDVTKTFSIGGWVSKLTYAWSADKKTLTVKPVDTLASEAYVPNPDNSVSGPAPYTSITVTVTASDGQAWSGQATTGGSSGIFNPTRPDLKVHTENGIEILNTNLKASAINKSLPYVNSDNTKLSAVLTAGLAVENDSIKTTDSLKVYFSRALDSAYIVNNLSAAVQLRLGGVPLNISVLFADSKKTMIVVPTIGLSANTSYVLDLVKVFAQGLSQADASAKVSSGVTASYAFTFKTRATAVKPVTATQVALNGDTAAAANVYGKRLAYGGSIGNAYAFGIDAGDVAAQNKIKLMWYEAAFRSMADTVTHYQLSVKGVDGNWYDLQTLVPAAHYNSFSPLTDSLHRYTLDLSAAVLDINSVNIGPTLRVPSKTNFNNVASIFNYGATLQVRIRPVVSADGLWDAADQSGTWSTPITFQDNAAPCDTDFVANAGSPANVIIPANGGVSVATLAPFDGIDRSAITSNGDYIFTFTFPEDMDTSSAPSNVPAITTYYGGVAGAPSPGIAVNAAKCYWTSGNVYHLTMTIPGSVNWSGTGALLPYYSISVAGMKDASGNAIQSWGGIGTAANNTLVAAVTGSSQGTVNLIGLTAY